jgi:hypothetical protein
VRNCRLHDTDGHATAATARDVVSWRMESTHQLSSAYLLGYLRGRLKAFRNRNLGFSHVEGALQLARRHEVPAAEIAAVFAEFGLVGTDSELTLVVPRQNGAPPRLEETHGIVQSAEMRAQLDEIIASSRQLLATSRELLNTAGDESATRTGPLGSPRDAP